MSEWTDFLSALEERLDEILAESPQLAPQLAEVVEQLKHAELLNRRLIERCFEEALRSSPIGLDLFRAAFGSEAVARRKALGSVGPTGPATESTLTEEQRTQVIDDAEQLLKKSQRRQGPADREITVTGHTLVGARASRFARGETYKLRFHVGPPVEANLASGDTSISGVPSGGLKTHWVVTSADVEFVPELSSAAVEKIGETWLAEFDLLIPESGTSKTEEVAFRAGALPGGSVRASIYAVSTQNTRELYREVSVSLGDRPELKADVTCKALPHTHLGTTHEWTTPPEHLQVLIINSLAHVSTKRIRLEDHAFSEMWGAPDNLISGAIKNVRDSLEKLRERQDAYLNDLNEDDMAARLAGGTWRPSVGFENGWQPLPDQADQEHRDAFSSVLKSNEWRALARDGYALFDTCFGQSRLRGVLEALHPGSRIDFHWTGKSGAGVVSHVPWALMYLEPVDVTGQVPPDPEKFMGLRLRIGARSYDVDKGSVALGDLQTTHSVHLMYWGDKPGDQVTAEALWQAGEFSKRTQCKLLPAADAQDLRVLDRKRQIVLAIDAPAPSPVGVLYFYCHCSVGDGNQPCLRFGNTSQGQDTVGRADLSQKSMPEGPLVFINACSTAQSDPHMTNELEHSFFRRGVRAFVGTETKVPVKLASKFAWLYFQFFNRMVDPAPMAAGEALAQARLFLWTQFKNVGGLFYSITNQYDLFLASEQEIRSLSPLRKER